MPNLSEYDNKNDWMGYCVPYMVDEGKDKDAAVAACTEMWRKRDEKGGARHSRSDRDDIQTVHDISVRQGAVCENAIKTISKTDTELRVGNHIVLFGGRDMTGIENGEKNADGSVGEFFTKDTDLESPYTKTGFFHVDFEHGRDPDNVGNHKDNVLGYVDWKTAKTTDEGVFVERVLNRRKRYVKWLEKLIDAGLIGNSSEGINVQKKSNGEIVRWGLRRDTLTVNPMEPRMLSTNVLAALKSLAIEFPHLKSYIPDSDDTALTDPEADENKPTQTKGVFTMDKEVQDAINAGIQASIAAALEKRDAEEKARDEKAAELKAAEQKGYAAAVEDLKNRRPFNINTKTELGFSEEKDAVPAFKHWMATGEVNGGLITPDASFNKIGAGKAAWNVTTPASGAYLVPDPLYNQIIAKEDNPSWVRQADVQFFQTEADHLLVPVETTKHTAFVKTAEAAAYNENEGEVGQKDLILYKYTNLTKVNEEFLAFQGTNWESWFANAMRRAIAVTENSIFTDGDGSGDPQGVAVGASDSGLTLATVDTITPAELTALVGTLGAGYNTQGDCGFLMNNATKWYLKGLNIAGQFAFVSSPQGGDFFGYPAWIDDDIDSYTTEAAKVVIFGNMKYFGVVEKPGLLVQRNPWLYMGTGQVGIFTSIYRGSGVLQSEAIKYLTSHA